MQFITHHASRMFDIQIAVAKTNKYASRESGDTAEVVERPQGGFSVVIADGQGSGQPAKSLSHLVTTKVVSLLKDGVRDGVAARAVHDYLYTYRGGKVSATLSIVSVDLATRTLVLSCNSHCPVLLSSPGCPVTSIPEQEALANPIGVHPSTRPVVREAPLEGPLYAVVYTDGLMEAGRRSGSLIDLPSLITECLENAPTARQLADHLLAHALDLDANRPSDDMTVSVVVVLPLPDIEENKIVPLVRRMEVRVPVE